jgi:hypothetical protein
VKTPALFTQEIHRAEALDRDLHDKFAFVYALVLEGTENSEVTDQHGDTPCLRVTPWPSHPPCSLWIALAHNIRLSVQAALFGSRPDSRRRITSTSLPRPARLEYSRASLD